MKAFLFVIAFFVATCAIGQEKFLTISNNETGKVSEFKQNQRVRIKTAQGGKIKGNLLIVDDTQIMVKNILIPISNIEQIKSNPILMNVLVSGTLFVIGAYGVVGGLVAIAWTGGELIGYIAILIGATSITGAILSPNILPATKINSTSTISVLTRMQ